MGSSVSKITRTAGARARKYPTRVPNVTNNPPRPLPPQHSKPGPSVDPPPQVSDSNNQAIDLDAHDPLLASRLNTLGAVQPNPHYSPSSTSPLDPERNISPSRSTDPNMPHFPPEAFSNIQDNPAIRVLQARQRIQDEAEEELAIVGRKGFRGRKYVDAGTIGLALMRKEKGEAEERIEDSLRIRKGRLRVLGKGVVEAV
ncbi:uncharacterized protein BDR25DRAFT_339463 [Lindgomyces ingoldianus]|uniref:Uncharacterized protein n=1 Tax=Lindgomyces ingoldianus TaxID=673940 RepID=A0ACB6RD64_9PLEO|nr:uncharacterized protein BDR25DRAFT_339463 [Lindgomyces ingoldianus]KAF2476457.1 hypothetical protein BDR25DRAFT_339463 [Lindgomyces ingoldianus]